MKKIISRIRLCTKSFFASSTPNKVIAALFGVAVLAVVGLLVLGQVSARTAYIKNTRMITIYDDATTSSKAIITSANTTAAVLKAADITVSSHDNVVSTLNAKNHATIALIYITRARRITVMDGARTASVLTAAQSNDEIAKAAGDPLLSHDEATLSPSKNFIGVGAGLIMTITRAKTVHLKLYGHAMDLRTQKTTVAAFLTENKIKLAKDDTMSISNNASITDGMDIQIWRNGVQTVSGVEPIAFSTQKVNDSTKNAGYDQITTSGQNGQETCIYQVTMQNGQETARTQISCVTTVQPVTQIEVIGTKVTLPSGSHTDWMNEAGVAASDQGYVNYIFSHESGWRPSASNGRYYGLGQTSLGTLTNTCGATWASDPVCQIGVFTNYANSRYGSWAAAYAAWTSKGWW